jgi:SAM-dependent methyltransferase
VTDFRTLLACPACRGPIVEDWRCGTCGAAFDAPDGIPNLRLATDPRTDIVRKFYDEAPFPGYPLRDTLATLRARAERSRFAQLLDRAIAPDARVAEVGCGTGQMSLYLARADRVIVAADLARASLSLGAAAARRYGVESVHFVETDLHRAGLRAAAFDVVYSAGVVHHTSDPAAAFASLVPLARPGGFVIVGVYNAFARIPLRLRRAVARITAGRVVPFDPVLRDRDSEPARRTAWFRDQYQHPEEHRHTLAEVQQWFRANEVTYLRSYPSVVFEDDSADLFAPAEDDWGMEAWIAQIGWMRTLGKEGGLFFVIGARRT